MSKRMVHVELGLDALGEYIKEQGVDWNGISQAVHSVGTAIKRKYPGQEVVVGRHLDPSRFPSKTRVFVLEWEEGAKSASGQVNKRIRGHLDNGCTLCEDLLAEF